MNLITSVKMLFYCGLLMLFLSSVRTGNLNDNRLAGNQGFGRSVSYSYWPSIHNAAEMMRIRKRELEQVGQNEGGGIKNDSPLPLADAPALPVIDTNDAQQQPAMPEESLDLPNALLAPSVTNTNTLKQDTLPKVSGGSTTNNTDSVVNLSLPPGNTTKTNGTVAESTDKVDLSGPGVVKRGAIVFGGFGLLAVAYFIFYKRKSKNNDANNTHGAIDANQFRYGVLQSEDRRDNMELSHVPLTMESDDEEDDDLEIFDLEQKKKSMSYVNLQVNDEEVVNGPREGSVDDGDNLLLDIEDANTDALINWSNSGNRSIL